jgi:NAD(P)-dependent dehydrogenase (short-subunit alcohol dehydrogenase family)
VSLKTVEGDRLLALVTSAIALLEKLGDDRVLLAQLPEAERKRLLEASSRLANPSREDRRRIQKRFRLLDRDAERAHDAAQTSATGIRATRTFVTPQKQLLPVREVFEPAEQRAQLKRPRACYVCKTKFTELHFFYDALCPPCAALNYGKRLQTHPLDGKVALVTGARVKIGYQAALILLRAGARVVVTTRFVNDCAERFAREPDHAAFSPRLQIFGIDLRHAPSVELLCAHLCQTLPRLDVLINNAAQTVRRPAGFYAHLLERERVVPAALPEAIAQTVAAHHAFARTVAPADGQLALRSQLSALGVLGAAELSQAQLLPDDATSGAHFPEGLLDGDRQQVDLRDHNSWRMKAADVSLPELVEVHLVNTIAPFIFNARLRPLMAATAGRDKHIVNVSAMEASFSRRLKTDKHPHTNMAKAALNMMTRTSASEYACDHIFMNSVDTGWVTDEDPLIHVSRKQRVHEFFPPLDSVDGAARVLDPLFSGLRTGAHLFGRFFKDYREAEW